jgi:multidrug resistance efflux pump
MTFSKSRILILVIIIAAIGYWFLSRKTAQAVNLGSVTKGDVIQRVTVAGAVAPNKRSIITAPFKGYVQNLYVKLGQAVKEGTPLFSLSESLVSPENNHPIRAPFSGTVVQVQKSEGEYVKDNDLTDFVLRIDDFSKFFVLAEAPEIEAIRLKVGQEAIIRAAAVVNRSYKGIVREISLAAKTSQPKPKRSGHAANKLFSISRSKLLMQMKIFALVCQC